MKIKLISLRLRNFKGVQDFTCVADGMSIQITGANDTGKSTVADALCWLLFDKDQQNRSADKFGIKTRVAGTVQQQLEHSVEAVFEVSYEIGIGVRYTMKKVYAENWQRARGSDSERLTGHTVNYYITDDDTDIDLCSVKQNEYVKMIEDNIQKLDVLKMLMLPHHFADQLDDKTRRSIITALTSELTIQDVITAGEDLESYPQIRGSLSHEDAKQRVNNQITSTKKEIDQIKPRIDENTLKLVDVEDDQNVLEIRLSNLFAELQTEMDNLKAEPSDKIAELHTKRIALQGTLPEIREKYLAEYSEKLHAHMSTVSDAATALNDVKTQHSTLMNGLAAHETNISREIFFAKERHTYFNYQITKLKESIADLEQSKKQTPTECFACNQKLPAKNVNTQLAQIADAIKAKQQSIAEIVKQADDKLKEIDQITKTSEATTAQIKAKIEAKAVELAEHTAAHMAAHKSYLEHQMNKPDMSECKEHRDANNLLLEYDKQISEIKAGTQDLNAPIMEKVNSIKQQISEVEKMITVHDTNKQLHQRIAELQQLRKKLAEQLVQAEKNKIMIERYERTEANLLTDSINKHFDNVTFILFKDQINGGLATCCEVAYKGVPYSEGLNASGKIRAGVEISGVLCSLYDSVTPVIVDTKESVDNLPATDQQMICMLKDASVKKLTVNKY